VADKYRLITRSDFDGLVCAVLLRELDMIDEIEFVHPKDMQDGRVKVTSRDITANLPYAKGVYLAFDHHASEISRVGRPDNYIIDANAPSAARVVYKHYGAEKKFPRISAELMAAVDKSDSAQFSRDDILNPTGWTLLSFIMDARTGLGRFHDFNISNKELMHQLIELIRTQPLEKIMQHEDVRQRLDLYREHAPKAAEQIKKLAAVHQNLVVLDTRDETTIYAGNRFLVYALFPETNISIHVLWGKQNQNVSFACGKSILKRDSKTDVGELMLKYGGGGHKAAGTCQVEVAKADKVLGELIAAITSDG
jgi:nanoRNase/pAp phosphatase (c-di-AMP/oligoRNAs hydrolase)